jgi:hypothetical protein
MGATTQPAAKKTADIQILRCLNPECRGVLEGRAKHRGTWEPATRKGAA